MESTKDVEKNVEVNEYQEALDRLKTHCLSSPSLQNGEENGFGPDYDMHHDCYEDETQLLQELVDKVPYYEQCEAKAIPMKPIELYDEFKDSYTNCCPKCELEVDENYCPNCGQMLDWSKDE